MVDSKSFFAIHHSPFTIGHKFMSTLAEAKKALQFNKEFTVLVDILKGIAASQFQALMRKRKKFEKFAESFDGFFRLVDFAKIDSPFIRPRSETTGVVMVTSDEGFMGDLNAKVIEAALKDAGAGKKELYVLGAHGLDAVKERGFSAQGFPGVEYEKRYEQALAVKERVAADVSAGKVGRLTVTYPHPVSFTVQRPVVVPLLPCAELFKKQENLLSDKTAVILESQPEKLIEHLVGIWITSRLTDFFEESKLAEFAAKTMHLEQSYDRLTEQGKVLKHRYFRCRRELIDKGTRETFASILLRRNLEA